MAGDHDGRPFPMRDMDVVSLFRMTDRARSAYVGTTARDRLPVGLTRGGMHSERPKMRANWMRGILLWIAVR